MYRYRCGTCRTTSPLVRTRREADAERVRHRSLVHAGLIPDGEEIQSVTLPPRPGQPTRPIHYVAYAAAAVALALIIWARLLA